MKVWEQVTKEGLDAAMDDFQEATPEQLKERFPGFQAPRGRHMFYKRRGPFPARLLLALAVDKTFPRTKAVAPDDFVNSDAHDFLVAKWGFESRKIE